MSLSGDNFAKAMDEQELYNRGYKCGHKDGLELSLELLQSLEAIVYLFDSKERFTREHLNEALDNARISITKANRGKHE